MKMGNSNVAESNKAKDRYSLPLGGLTRNVTPFLFHDMRSPGVHLSTDRYIVKRFELGQGVCFSSRPMMVDELICVRTVLFNKGNIKFGLTNRNPESLSANELTDSLDLSSGSCWLKDLPRSASKQGNELFFYFTSSGEVFYGWNKKEKGLLFKNISVELDRPLWAIFEITGKMLAIEIIECELPVERRRSFRNKRSLKRSQSLEFPSRSAFTNTAAGASVKDVAMAVPPTNDHWAIDDLHTTDAPRARDDGHAMNAHQADVVDSHHPINDPRTTSVHQADVSHIADAHHSKNDPRTTNAHQADVSHIADGHQPKNNPRTTNVHHAAVVSQTTDARIAALTVGAAEASQPSPSLSQRSQLQRVRTSENQDPSSSQSSHARGKPLSNASKSTKKSSRSSKKKVQLTRTSSQPVVSSQANISSASDSPILQRIVPQTAIESGSKMGRRGSHQVQSGSQVVPSGPQHRSNVSHNNALRRSTRETSNNHNSPVLVRNRPASSRNYSSNVLNSDLSSGLESKIPMPFHYTVGQNVYLSSDRTDATRQAERPCNGYVFTRRPMRLGEKLVVSIADVDPDSTNGLTFGLTVCDPGEIQSTDLPDDSDKLYDRPEYWVVHKDLCVRPEIGEELGFQLTKKGEVHYIRNGQMMSTLMHVDTTLPLWAFIDIVGGIRKIKSLGVVLDRRSRKCMSTNVSTVSHTPSSGVPHSSSSSRLASAAAASVTPTTRAAEGVPPRSNAQPPGSSAGGRDSGAPFNLLQSMDPFNDIPSMLAPPLIPVPVTPARKPLQQSSMVTPAPELSSRVTPATKVSIPVSQNLIDIDLSSLDPLQSTKQDVQIDDGNFSSRDWQNKSVSECTVCFECPPDCALYTCGHMCMCYECATKIIKGPKPLCPLCRQPIKDVLKIFKS